ncbi:MAG: type II toxin-antitoxin system HicB family antitoxin [Candidatus Daviesbacteria bacterium]|nr:type II toxin-antitoxin system HicB family antitoxin [Candidatus Daviesbacteria bacterium]
MEKQVLNYRIIIEPEKMGKKTVYNAYCPTLGIADYGDSIDEVLKSIKDGIELALKCLAEEGKEIPIDNIREQTVTTTEVRVPEGAKVAFA